jgi:hypothetical protein
MISRAEMMRGPQVAPENLPILGDKEVKEYLSSKVLDICDSVFNPDTRGTLFSFTGEEFSRVLININMDKEGVIETDRLQKLGLEVMKEFGFNEKVSSKKTVNNKDGTSLEAVSYPSQTLPGMVFECVKELNGEGKISKVTWNVIDD